MYDINPFNLPSVTLNSIRDLPTETGVYFAISQDAILYIGKSENLRDRWSDHS